MHSVTTRLLCLLPCVLLVLHSPRAGASTDSARDGFLGRVQRVVIEKTAASFGFSPGEHAFDQESAPSHRSGDLPSSVSPAAPSDSPDTSRLLWRTYAYNTEGKQTEVAFYADNGTLRWLWRYTYGSQGRRVARTSYDANRVMRWKWQYVYDQQGHLIEQAEYDTVGDVVRQWHYIYDAAGNVVEETNHDTNGTLLWKWRYTYDTTGRRIEQAQYGTHDTPVRLWRYTYDTRGNLLEETSYSAFWAPLGKRRYAYDARGNVSEELRYRADGSLQGKWRHTYEYDAMGNWVKRTTTSWFPVDFAVVEPSEEVTYRTLTYYRDR